MEDEGASHRSVVAFVEIRQQQPDEHRALIPAADEPTYPGGQEVTSHVNRSL